MLKSLTITRFRGVKEGTIPNLRQVNLFVGPNNSGKSTILDALLLASGAYERKDVLGRSPYQVLNERHNLPPYNVKEPCRALWYGYDQSCEVEFEFTFVNGSALHYRMGKETRGDLTLRPPGPGSQVIVAMEGFGEPPEGEDFAPKARPRVPTMSYRQSASQEASAEHHKVRGFLRDLVLIDSEFRRARQVEALLWQQIISDRRDKVLMKMLHDVYGMTVEGLTFTPFLGDNSLLLLLPSMSVRVDDLGDGARYFMRMMMVLSALKDTTLLLEEPETAHHCRAQADVARRIVRAAKERNLQVLATTHSLETVDHFLAACAEHSVEFELHHTELKAGVLSCRGVDRHDARVLMDMGVDPRCAP